MDDGSPDMLAANWFTGNSTIGRLTGLTEDGAPLIEIAAPTGPQVLAARTIVDISIEDLGRDVVVMLDPGAPDAPVVLGCIRAPRGAGHGLGDVVVSTEDACLTLSAEREIKLSCGQSSVTLTKSGKIVLRGTHIVSRATGANKIKGGSIQLN